MPNLTRKKNSSITVAFLATENKLRKYVMRFFVRSQDIEDTVQETFLRAYEAEKAGKIQSPKAFLFKVAKNIALNELTKKSNILIKTMGELGDFDVIGSKESIEKELEVILFLESLSDIFGSLPPQCLKVLVMRKVYGFSHKEISERLGISVKTIEKHMKKALSRCVQEVGNMKDGKGLGEIPSTGINDDRSVVLAMREE